jgi:pimeloyl-ACP methyl ester carboxylesterase
MVAFVLIHGSWHTGKHWTPVIEHLKSKGHSAVAPTVLGHGAGVEKRVNHAQQVDDLVRQIVLQDPRDLVMVGHSYGGTIFARAAEEIPDRIRRLVFWNAFVPDRGHSLNDEVPPHYRALFEQVAAASPDRSVMLPYGIWREAFINDADEALAKSSYETLSPEPYQPFVDKPIWRAFMKPRFRKATSTAPRIRRCRKAQSGDGIRGCRSGWGCSGWCRCREATRSCSPIRPGLPRS